MQIESKKEADKAAEAEAELRRYCPFNSVTAEKIAYIIKVPLLFIICTPPQKCLYCREIAETLERFTTGEIDAEGFLDDLRDMGIEVECTADQLTLTSRYFPSAPKVICMYEVP